jgi:hypothetical protein
LLNRQRILLYMMHKAGGAVSRIQLMKWAFLLTKETSSRGGSAFYDFIPYKYGPYSFLLRQDMRYLVKNNFVWEPDEKTWSIITGDDTSIERPREFEDASRILLRYRDTALDDLIACVYFNYPWYTINCERKIARKEERPLAQPAVFTIGYQGLSIDAFLNTLLENGIEILADVRNSPLSRTFGFHKSTMHRLCENLGIEYCGFRELGIPPSERANLNAKEDRDKLFEKYEQRVLEFQTETLKSLAEKICLKPTALLCMESDPQLCHRSELARIMSLISGLPIIHIRGA